MYVMVCSYLLEDFVLFFLNNSYFNSCEMVSYCGFNLYFYNDWWLSIFSVFIGYLYVFRRIFSFKSFILLLNFIVV